MAKKLLIIDDEADIREVARASLEIVGGFSVLTAESGRRGIVMAEEHLPDAIILDLMMPEMDGAETLARLKENPKVSHIPVIFLTAKVAATGPRVPNPAGVLGVLLKPFDPMQLPAQVSELLTRKTSPANGASNGV